MSRTPTISSLALSEISTAIPNSDWTSITHIMGFAGEERELKGKPLMKHVMQTWTPRFNLGVV